MAIAIRAYQPEDVPALVEIWNEVLKKKLVGVETFLPAFL